MDFTSLFVPATSPKLETLYVERLALERQLKQALADSKAVLVYGLPRQGKSTVVRRTATADKSITVLASADMGFADIFRAYLMALGCSISVERTKRKKLGTTAEVKFAWPFVSAGGSVDGEVSADVTERSLSADIGSPNDVCYLLKEFHDNPTLIIDRFELLSRKTRALLLNALPLLFDSDALRMVLVSSSQEEPLDHLERLALDRYIRVVQVPPLSEAETRAFVEAAFEHVNLRAPEGLAAFVYGIAQGGVQLTLDACALAADKLASEPPRPADDLRTEVLSELQQRVRANLLAILTALIEKDDWQYACTQRLAPDSPDGSEAAEAAVPIAPQLAKDPVFLKLQQALTDNAEPPDDLPDPAKAIWRDSAAFAKRVLASDVTLERLRMVAHGLGEFLGDPDSDLVDAYQPSYAAQGADVNYGVLIAWVLMAADPDKSTVLDIATTASFLATQGLTPRSHGGDGGASEFRRMARRLRRLQRRLAISPPPLRVAPDFSTITVWEPRDFQTMGDVRPYLKELVDFSEDESDS